MKPILLFRFLPAALLTIALTTTAPLQAADVRVRNNSSERVWVSYALYYYYDAIGNGDGRIEGGWTINPGETKTLFRNDSGVRSVWLNVWKGSRQLRPSGRDTFTIGRREAIRIARGVPPSNRDKLRFLCAVPQWVMLSNSSYLLQPNDLAINIAGERVTRLPRPAINFSPYTTEADHTILESVRKHGDHFFFKTTLTGKGGTFTVR
jgi:hypothetical protein